MYGAKIKKVKTGTEKSFSDWGLILENSMPQETPDIKKTSLDIPGVHGELDLS